MAIVTKKMELMYRQVLFPGGLSLHFSLVLLVSIFNNSEVLCKRRTNALDVHHAGEQASMLQSLSLYVDLAKR